MAGYERRGTAVASLAGAYASRRMGRIAPGLAAFVGDSITAWNGNGSPLRQRETYAQVLCILSKQRIRYGAVYATAGYTLSQIRDTLLPQVLAMTPLPSVCFIQGVENDMSGSANPAFTIAYSLSAVNDMCNSLFTAGIKPILVTAPPRGDAADPNVHKWNVALRRYADSVGVAILDAHDALLNAADGTRNTTVYNADGIHPEFPGHLLIAQRGITDGLDQQFPGGQRTTSKTSGDATNLIPSGYGLFATNAAGKGTGWTNSATLVTYSIVAPIAADDLVGNWQQMVRATGGAATSLLQLTSDITTGFSVGDKIAFSGRFQTSAMAGSGSTYTAQVAYQGVAVQNLEPVYNFDIDIADGTFYGEAVIPTGVTGLRPQIIQTVPTVGPTTIRVGQLTLTNLTTAGTV